MTPLEVLAQDPRPIVPFETDESARPLVRCLDQFLEHHAKRESALRAEPAIFILHTHFETHWLLISWHDPAVYPGPNGGLHVMALRKTHFSLAQVNDWLADYLARQGDSRFLASRQ